MKKDKGKGAVSADPVAKARHARGTRPPTTPPTTVGKSAHIGKAARGAGD